jgi:transient receptor potential cation channel subfamily A protein 1
MGADITAEDAEGATPLHYAAQEGALEIGKQLYTAAAAKGVQRSLVERRNNENGTCLHLAVESGYDEMARLCIQMGADVNAEMNNGWTPLHLAAKQGHVPSASLLIEGRADIEAGDINNATPLHVAARYNQVKMVEFLLDKDADIESKDEDSFTPLLTASSFGRTKVVEVLLQQNADVEQTDLNGRTALHWATKGNHKNTALALMANETGSSLVNAPDSRSKYPLHIAAKKGFVELAKVLLKDAIIDAKNDEEKTPLHLAAMYGRVRLIRLLAAHNKSIINDEDEGSNMPIHLASLHGHAHVVEALLELGAQVDARNALYWTPLDCASFKGHLNVVTTLLEGDSPVNPQDKAGMAPLHLASREGHVAVVKVLLQWDADVSLKDHNGFNCLDHAIEHHRAEVAELIVKSENWVYALSNAHVQQLSNGSTVVETPLRKLIKNLPDVAEMVFNRCMTSNISVPDGITSQSANFTVVMNYRFLDDIELAKKMLHDKLEGMNDADDTDGDEEFDKKSVDTIESSMSVIEENHLRVLAENNTHLSKDHPLTIMVKAKRERLLGHPLISGLLRHKWQSFGRYIYYLNLLVFLAYLAAITAYAAVIIPPTAFNHVMASKNHCINANVNDSIVPGPETCSSSNNNYFMAARVYMIIFACIRLFIFELFQLYYLGREYFAFGNAIANGIEWISFTTAVLFGLPLNTPYNCMVKEWQWQCGTVAVFLAWFNLLVIIRKLPKLGIYIVMFLDILKTFLQFLIVGALFVIAFGMAFYMLLTKDVAFTTPGKSLMKTFVMTTGEFEFDRFFNEEDVIEYGVLSYMLWIVFLIVMPILLMNLLVGLAVEDIKDVQENAKLQRLAMQVELVLGVEANLPSFILRRFTKPEDTIMPNRQRGALGELRGSVFGHTLTSQSITAALEDHSTPVERLEGTTEELRQTVGQLQTDMKKLVTQNKRLTRILKSLARKQDVRVSLADDDEDEDEDGEEEQDRPQPARLP